MPPPVCALGDRGRAQRAARWLQEAFSWSALHQIAKQLGSPTLSQGEEGGVGETGVLLCFCASAPPGTAPVGLAAGARPTHPLSTPQALGQPPPGSAWDRLLGQAVWKARLRPRARRVLWLQSGRVGVHAQHQLLTDPTLGNHLPNNSCLMTYCAPGSGQIAEDEIGPCPHGGATVAKEETAREQGRESAPSPGVPSSLTGQTRVLT